MSQYEKERPAIRRLRFVAFVGRGQREGTTTNVFLSTVRDEGVFGFLHAQIPPKVRGEINKKGGVSWLRCNQSCLHGSGLVAPAMRNSQVLPHKAVPV